METIPAFWVGARIVAHKVDLPALAERAGGWEALARAGRSDLQALGVPPEEAQRWAAARDEQTLGRVLTLADPAYPERLRRLPGAPAVLCLEGDPAALEGLGVGVVGTRRCTAYGVAVTRHLAGALADRGVVVVSGLARGIDSHAHKATLGRGRTVAVLGHGLAHTAPASNRPLRARIVDGGGAVVSAFPDRLGPARWTFPVRNRWIAGLSEHVVVIEAPRRSGALITATEAASFGREVWAVPAALGVESSAGCLELLALGARPIVSVEGWVAQVAGAAEPVGDPLLERLAAGDTAVQAARALGRPVTEVLARVAEHEVEGRLTRLPGHRYAVRPGES